MSSANGIRGTANLGVTRKYDVADVISLLDVARYPLLGILTFQLTREQQSRLL
ncbi:MAG: hypothetical protein UY78_C0019G0002 [Parcubacteria group bacterium GW2011_GWA1_53_13]|nr:MAG: hypothetical protein UY78_C0019G0002 [Parcubacteria group bacterium GW2011_GWA1_53_13]